MTNLEKIEYVLREMHIEATREQKVRGASAIEAILLNESIKNG